MGQALYSSSRIVGLLSHAFDQKWGHRPETFGNAVENRPRRGKVKLWDGTLSGTVSWFHPEKSEPFPAKPTPNDCCRRKACCSAERDPGP